MILRGFASQEVKFKVPACRQAGKIQNHNSFRTAIDNLRAELSS